MIDKIINDLVSHEISKHDAIDRLRSITDGLRSNSALKFTVDEVGYTVENDDCVMQIRLPYGYKKVKDKFKKGDEIDIMQIP